MSSCSRLLRPLALFSRFFHSTFYGFFEDDFFYYALVAKHLVLQHISSFNGLQLTNGYHPLWLVVVTICYVAFPGTGFFIAVQAVAFIAILLYYFGILRCLTFLGVSQTLTRLAALVLSLHALLLFRYGMEVDLALPVGIWTLAFLLSPSFRWTPRQTFLYGLLASLTVLARLDSVFLFALLIIAQTLTPEAPWRERLERIGIFTTGWFPFFAYLALNWHIFGTLLPVSGTAKQLKPFWPPTAIPLHSLFFPVDRTKLAFVYPAVLVIAICAVAFLLHRRTLTKTTKQKAILAALFVFPAVHMSVLCFLSDWPVWPWYFYSLDYAALAAFTVLLPAQLHEPASASTSIAARLLAAATLCFITFLTAYAFLKQPPYKILSFVSTFANQHPGIYAMGDGSGTPAYLSTQPFLQLEGLMMDAEYLHLLRQRTPLPFVLRRYHADYYVAFVPKRTGPCLTVYEPAQGGSLSPKLPGKICAQPLAQVSEAGNQVQIYHAADVQLP